MEKKSAQDYIFGRVIGEGSFSTVYIAKEVNGPKEYAIKVCEKTKIIRENKQEYVTREKSALHLLNSSPGIISLSCTFQDPRKLYFVLTYAPNGELLKYINRLGFLSPECSKFYAAELLIAIEEMHKKNIIHRDLKPENLLLSRKMHLMIADFGSSKILPEDYSYESTQMEIEENQRMQEEANDSDSERPSEKRAPHKRKASFVGTAQYVSPEILKGHAAHFGTDLWALGCILYQMMTGEHIFKGATEYLIFQKILSGQLEFAQGFDSRAEDLISKLLRFKPTDRLGSADSKENLYQSIRNHSYFKGIDWNINLYTQTPPDMNLPNTEEGLNVKNSNFCENSEPGLGERQERRILQMELETLDTSDHKTSTENVERMLTEQRATHEYAEFVEDTELIIKYGFVNKRKKGICNRRRMLLLTSTPRLIYIDPVSKIKKGEIPFDASLTCERKNFRLFNLHTPNRVYYLDDSEGGANEWCEAIEKSKREHFESYQTELG